MSASQVLSTLRGAMQDAATGLAARVEALKAADPALQAVRSDVQWVRWSLAGRMQTTGQPNVAVSVRRVLTEQKLAAMPSRDGMWSVEIAYECFSADQGVIEDTVTTTATALLQVLDGLREYSDAHAGTVVDLEGQIDMQFGAFDGPEVNSFGFICRFTVLERSQV